MDSNQELEEKIRAVQEVAEKKHYEYRIGPICIWYSESELARKGFRMSYDHKYNMSQHCSVDKMDVFYKEELVYAYAYGMVTAYIKGEWEKLIPELYNDAIRRKDNAERKKERDKERESKKRARLKEQALRFGIKNN